MFSWLKCYFKRLMPQGSAEWHLFWLCFCNRIKKKLEVTHTQSSRKCCHHFCVCVCVCLVVEEAQWYWTINHSSNRTETTENQQPMFNSLFKHKRQPFFLDSRFTLFFFICWLVCQQDYTKNLQYGCPSGVGGGWVSPQNRSHLLLIQIELKGQIPGSFDHFR